MGGKVNQNFPVKKTDTEPKVVENLKEIYRQ